MNYRVFKIGHIYKNLRTGNATLLNTASQNLIHCNLQFTIISSISCYTFSPKKAMFLNSHTNCLQFIYIANLSPNTQYSKVNCNRYLMIIVIASHSRGHSYVISCIPSTIVLITFAVLLLY